MKESRGGQTGITFIKGTRAISWTTKDVRQKNVNFIKDKFSSHQRYFV